MRRSERRLARPDFRGSGSSAAPWPAAPRCPALLDSMPQPRAGPASLRRRRGDAAPTPRWLPLRSCAPPRAPASASNAPSASPREQEGFAELGELQPEAEAEADHLVTGRRLPDNATPFSRWPERAWAMPSDGGDPGEVDDELALAGRQGGLQRFHRLREVAPQHRRAAEGERSHTWPSAPQAPSTCAASRRASAACAAHAANSPSSARNSTSQTRALMVWFSPGPSRPRGTSSPSISITSRMWSIASRYRPLRTVIARASRRLWTHASRSSPSAARGHRSLAGRRSPR